MAAHRDTRCRHVLCNRDHHYADCPRRKQRYTQKQRDLRTRQRAKGSAARKKDGKGAAAKSDGRAGKTDGRRGVTGKQRRKK